MLWICHALDIWSPWFLTSQPLYKSCPFSLAAFKILPESVAFDSLMMMCMCGSLEFIYLEFIELIGGRDSFSSNLRGFQPLFLQIFFLSLPFSLLLLRLPLFIGWDFCLCSTGLWGWVHFSFCFSKLIISMNCFQVHLVFLLPFRVYHWDWPWIFHISDCTFQLQGFHMIFNYFHFFIGILYLMRSLIFLLFFRHIFFFYHFGYIWIPYLKFLSSKSNVWSSSETVSIDCLHIVHLLYIDHAFLFIWMSHNFL